MVVVRTEPEIASRHCGRGALIAIAVKGCMRHCEGEKRAIGSRSDGTPCPWVDEQPLPPLQQRLPGNPSHAIVASVRRTMAPPSDTCPGALAKDTGDPRYENGSQKLNGLLQCIPLESSCGAGKARQRTRNSIAWILVIASSGVCSALFRTGLYAMTGTILIAALIPVNCFEHKPDTHSYITFSQ